MLMMDWFTAGTSKKPRPSRPNFKRAWQSAAWSCIRQKPKSSTARTGIAKEPIRTSNSTFSDTVLWIYPRGQLLGAKSHADDDSGIGPPTSNSVVYGRHRPPGQSAPTGLD